MLQFRKIHRLGVESHAGKKKEQLREGIIIPGPFPKGTGQSVGPFMRRWGSVPTPSGLSIGSATCRGFNFYADKRLKIRKQFDILNVVKSLPL